MEEFRKYSYLLTILLLLILWLGWIWGYAIVLFLVFERRSRLRDGCVIASFLILIYVFWVQWSWVSPREKAFRVVGLGALIFLFLTSKVLT